MELKKLSQHVVGANIRDYGAHPSNTPVQNTTAITAAIAAGLQYYGGAVYVPAGEYPHHEVSVPQTYTGGLRLFGESKTTSRLRFVPTADNQIGFKVDRLSGGSIVNDNYSGLTLENLCFATNDTSYHKTGVKLVDTGQTSIRNVNIFGYTGTAKDAVGLHTLGRESLWVDGLHIVACVPIRIGVNPDTTSGWLSADHFHYSNLYLNASGTPSSLVSACVLVDDGVHCSQLTFDGGQAWVGGVHGLYWNQTVAPYAAPTNLSIANMRSEQGTSATGYSVYLNMHAAYPLYNLTLTNCELDNSREGLYSRYVVEQVWTSILAKMPSPRTIMDVGSAQSVTWRGVSTYNGTSATAVLTDANLYLSEASPHWSGQVWPTNATWTKRATASTYNERPKREMSAHKWYWSGTLADGVADGASGDGSVTFIPCNSDINSWAHAEIKVMATIAGSNIIEYGVWYAAPITGLTNGVVKASGSANTAATDTDANLCVFCSGASPMYQQMTVRNRLGASAVVTIEVTGKRSVET